MNIEDEPIWANIQLFGMSKEEMSENEAKFIFLKKKRKLIEN